MNNSIKRAQSQARLSFAERENFRPKVRQYKKLMMTLALLLTAVMGAWAAEKSETLATNNGELVYTGVHFKVTADALSSNYICVRDSRSISEGQKNVTIETLDGQNISKLDLQIKNIEGASINNMSAGTGILNFDTNTYVLTITKVDAPSLLLCLTEADQSGVISISSVTYYYEEPDIVVEWNASNKTGTFTQPGYDVVLTPIYAKVAAFATTGTEPEVKTLLPAAAEGVIAGTDAPLIVEGTVAFAGTSTEVKQGTVMYAVTAATVTEAPALTAFSATVPKASDIPNADDGAEVKVWYYIQGADAPQGEAATLDNTFNNSAICATPLTVTVLSNKFDITLNAANVNTIDATQASKGTVTVKEGTGAAVDKTSAITTDGKLKAVKMGSEVKLKANNGYKFRKVEVKKGAAGPVADIVWDVTNVSDLQVEGDYLSYTKEGIKLSGNAEQVQAEWNNSAYLGTPGMEFITMESGGFTFTAPTGKAFTKIEMKAQGSSGWGSANLGTGWAYNTGTVTWTGSAASTVKLLKDADMFSGDFISSIAFYLSE